MAAHDSKFPGEDKSHHTRWDKTGGSMSWRGWQGLAAAIVTLLGGTGGYVGLQFVTASELKESEVAHEARVEARVVKVEENVKTEVAGINAKIGGLEEKVDGVQNFQIKQDARQEARRLTENIRSRTEREKEYDRLRERNEKRLKDGEDPCTTLDCTN